MRFVLSIDLGPDEDVFPGEASRYIGRIASALASGATSGKIAEFGTSREIGSWGFVADEPASKVDTLLGAARAVVAARFQAGTWDDLKDAIARLADAFENYDSPDHARR